MMPPASRSGATIVACLPRTWTRIRSRRRLRGPDRRRAGATRERGRGAHPRHAVRSQRCGDRRAQRDRRAGRRRRQDRRAAPRLPARPNRAATGDGAPALRRDARDPWCDHRELAQRRSNRANAIAAILVEHVWAEALEDAVSRTGAWTSLAGEFRHATVLTPKGRRLSCPLRSSTQTGPDLVTRVPLPAPTRSGAPCWRPRRGRPGSSIPPPRSTSSGSKPTPSSSTSKWTPSPISDPGRRRRRPPGPACLAAFCSSASRQQK